MIFSIRRRFAGKRKNPTFRRLIYTELEYTVFYKEKKKNTSLKRLNKWFIYFNIESRVIPPGCRPYPTGRKLGTDFYFTGFSGFLNGMTIPLISEFLNYSDGDTDTDKQDWPDPGEVVT